MTCLSQIIPLDFKKHSKIPPNIEENDKDISMSVITDLVEKIMDCWTRRKLHIQSVSDITKLIVRYYNAIIILKWSTKYSDTDLRFHQNNRLASSKRFGYTSQQFAYASPRTVPVKQGIICWRIKVKNPTKGWMLFGINGREEFDIYDAIPSKRKCLYGISEKGFHIHHSQKARNNNIPLNILKTAKFEIDILLDTIKRELLFCMVGMTEFYPIARIWDLPQDSYVPCVFMTKSMVDIEIQIAEIENVLFGKKCGDIYSTEMYYNSSWINLPAIQLFMKERMEILMDKDQNVSKFIIKGNLEVQANDQKAAQCIIHTNINPVDVSKYGDIKWRIHPRFDVSAWKLGELCLKNDKAYPVKENQKVSICKWKLNVTKEECIPIIITYWPEVNGDKICVNAAFECDRDLKDVVIRFPFGGEINQITNHYNNDVGDIKYDDDEGMEWILHDVSKDGSGDIEWEISNGNAVDWDDLYPIQVEFKISDENTFSMMEIKNVTNKDYQEDIRFDVEKRVVVQKYEIKHSNEFNGF